MQTEHKQFLLEQKSVDLEESTFEGNSAGVGNIDHQDDLIEVGAFKKTIRESLRAGRVKLLDSHDAYSTTNLWGKATEAEERPYKHVGRGKPKDNAPTHVIWTKFFVSEADDNAQTALRKIGENILDALSIGYQAVKVEFEPKDGGDFAEDADAVWEWYMGRAIRRIKELKWKETSLVTWGANPYALVIQGTVKTLCEGARKAVLAGEMVSETEVKRAIQALENVLQDEDDVKKAVTTGGLAKTFQVPVEVIDETAPPEGKQDEDDAATAAGADGSKAVDDDTPPADKADDGEEGQEAAPDDDTQEPDSQKDESTPSEPSGDEEHFPDAEELDATLAHLGVLEYELTD